MNSLDPLSDRDLVTILSALELMASISVGYPPLEANQFYVASSELFDRVANEAMARGLSGYAELGPDLDGIYPGERIGEGSELELLKHWYQEYSFLDILSKVLGQLGAEKRIPNFSKMEDVEKSRISYRFEWRIRKILDDEGCESFLDMNRVASLEVPLDSDSI